MTSTAHFYRDFVRRTKEDLDKYSGSYEFTALINASFGLLLVPYEGQREGATLQRIWDKDLNEVFGLSPPFQLLHFEPIRGRKGSSGEIEYESKCFGALFRKLRNGFAHSNIQPINEAQEWVGIKVWNCFPVRRSDPEASTFPRCRSAGSAIIVKDVEIGFSWEQLHKFASIVAEEHLAHFEQK
jgi:hypothetical protein